MIKAAGLLKKLACVSCHATASPLVLSTHDGCLFCLGCLKTARPLPGEVLQGLRCALRPPIDEGTARALDACVLHMVGIHLKKRPPQPEYFAKRALRANPSGPKASSQYG